MPEGTESEAKERQGQNWPGNNLLPNLHMKIKVASFLFANPLTTNQNYLVFITGCPFKKLGVCSDREKNTMFD